MSFTPGDRVHLAGLGTGIIREARGGRRYAVEIKGRVVVAAAADLEPADPSPSPKRRANAPTVGGAPALSEPPSPGSGRGRATAGLRPAASSIDLHGMTVDEAIAAVEVFVNHALLAGQAEARVIHGRGGGRLKSAVHQYLRGLSAVASFHVDPRNPGVTIIAFE